MTTASSNIGLVIGGSIYLSEPPSHIDPVLSAYLNQLRIQLQEHVRQNFANMQLVSKAINSGTNAGVFTVSSGSKLTFVNGIVSSVG